MPHLDCVFVMVMENHAYGQVVNNPNLPYINRFARCVGSGRDGPRAYNHFSLLKSIEGGLGLPCLNHAGDSNVNVMSDLFGTFYNQPPATTGQVRGL